jgi:hypothetical protein
MNNTRIGDNLAKDVINDCIYANNKVRSNEEMTPQEFALWLINAKPAIIIFEAFGTSNYWHRVALVARRGRSCAAVALANKNVRSAYAMLTQGTDYKAELLSA